MKRDSTGIGPSLTSIVSQAPEADGHHVTYEWVPILISALFAYIVADCFISVYGVS